MRKQRLMQCIRLNFRGGATARGDYLRENHIMGYVGRNVRYQPRIIPLYPELIRLGNNIMIAAGVRFVTHDSIHTVLNGMGINSDFKEFVGCIKIGDNVFIGSNTTVLYNVKIGKNVIVSANSLVNKDLPADGVYAGIPAKRICSFYDFINKRKIGDYATVKINQNISEEEVRNAWSIFEMKRNQ